MEMKQKNEDNKHKVIYIVFKNFLQRINKTIILDCWRFRLHKKHCANLS